MNAENPRFGNVHPIVLHVAGPGSHTLGTSAPIAKFQHPSHALLENHGFKQIVYKKYHKRCLEERAQKGEPIHQHCFATPPHQHQHTMLVWCGGGAGMLGQQS